MFVRFVHAASSFGLTPISSFVFNLCVVFNYNCDSCVEAGCNWCPGDATCMSVTLDESFWQLNSHKTTTCPTASDWVNTCEPIREGNTFADPLYDSMAWVYEMIDVELVWDRKFTGAGIHVSCACSYSVKSMFNIPVPTLIDYSTCTAGPRQR